MSSAHRCKELRDSGAQPCEFCYHIDGTNVYVWRCPQCGDKYSATVRAYCVNRPRTITGQMMHSEITAITALCPVADGWRVAYDWDGEVTEWPIACWAAVRRTYYDEHGDVSDESHEVQPMVATDCGLLSAEDWDNEGYLGVYGPNEDRAEMEKVAENNRRSKALARRERELTEGK